MIWTPELLDAINAGWEAFRQRLVAEMPSRFSGEPDGGWCAPLSTLYDMSALLDPGVETDDDVVLTDDEAKRVAWALIDEALNRTTIEWEDVPLLTESSWVQVDTHLVDLRAAIHALARRAPGLERLR